jgi:lipopolysaccharide transport system ATP-binding protein
MPDSVITVENLGKRYRIRHQAQRQRYNTLRDVLADKAGSALRAPRSLLRRLWSAFRAPRSPLPAPGCALPAPGSPLPAPRSPLPPAEDFWALKKVSFEVKQGDVLGIIGRNGAGKSTLLKILSRITEPTEGRVRIKGRVASLLEVGTGFHPELTGRENIFLNGAILGMTRAEIRTKFDEIVAFAEVEKFLDTPVKRYSSGMYVRLAFAVAAHLEPEILIVDEVLAVGDAQFQRKCLGKMGEVAKGGRTVLFVSHNMNSVENLCKRVLVLDKGRLWTDQAEPRKAIALYLSKGAGPSSGTWTNVGHQLEHPVFQPLEFTLLGSDNLPVTAALRSDERVRIMIRGKISVPDPAFNVGYAISNEESVLLYWSLTTDVSQQLWPNLQAGEVSLFSELPSRFLNEGSYRLEMIASLHCREWIVRPGYNSPMIRLEIRGGLSDSPYWQAARPGILAPVLAWNSKT